MECLLSEIEKIKGEREVDIRIKDCLLELYTRQQNIMDNMQFPECDRECCDCEPEGKPLTEALAPILDSKATVKIEVEEEDDELKDETKSDS